MVNRRQFLFGGLAVAGTAAMPGWSLTADRVDADTRRRVRLPVDRLHIIDAALVDSRLFVLGADLDQEDRYLFYGLDLSEPDVKIVTHEKLPRRFEPSALTSLGETVIILGAMHRVIGRRDVESGHYAGIAGPDGTPEPGLRQLRAATSFRAADRRLVPATIEVRAKRRTEMRRPAIRRDLPYGRFVQGDGASALLETIEADTPFDADFFIVRPQETIPVELPGSLVGEPHIRSFDDSAEPTILMSGEDSTALVRPANRQRAQTDEPLADTTLLARQRAGDRQIIDSSEIAARYPGGRLVNVLAIGEQHLGFVEAVPVTGHDSDVEHRGIESEVLTIEEVQS